MTPSIIASVVTVLLLAAPLGLEAQPQPSVVRIGFLRPGPLNKEMLAAFEQSLRDLGYVEGKNLVIEYRVTDGSLDPLPRLAEELVRLRVDVILASTGAAAQAARKVTTTVPIVFVAASDPVGTGLVSSLTRPGGNVTGLSVSPTDLAGKRLEMLREVVPRLKRVAILSESAAPANAALLKGAKAAAAALGLQSHVLSVRSPDDLGAALNEARAAGGLLLLDSSLFLTHRARLADLAIGARLPAIANNKYFVESGGLMSFGADYLEMYRRSAGYVDKILKGAKPGDIPVKEPRKFELVINRRTAKALGLAIPSALLLRADHVIE